MISLAFPLPPLMESLKFSIVGWMNVIVGTTGVTASVLEESSLDGSKASVFRLSLTAFTQ